MNMTNLEKMLNYLYVVDHRMDSYQFQMFQDNIAGKGEFVTKLNELIGMLEDEQYHVRHSLNVEGEV